MNEKELKIRALIEEADACLAEAAELAEGAGGSFYFEGPDYGMGGWLRNGAWEASSQSC